MYFTDQNLLESGYLTELKLSFEIQNWSKLKDRAQRVDKKNAVILLVMFTPRIMVIKMSKMVDFVVHFLLDTAKYHFQFGKDI